MSSSTSCAICVRYGYGPPYRPILRVLAVDDEVPVLEELVYLLRGDDRVASADGVSDVAEALRLLSDRDHPFDAVFLDIRMPGVTGMDLARMLARFAEPPMIVFVSAHDDSAVQAFDLKAVDYVLKPVREERLADAVHRVLHAVGESRGHGEPQRPVGAEPVSQEPATSEGDVIPVELGGVTRFLKLGDVRFAEAEGDYARLHTGDGSFLVRVPLSTLEERWRGSGFERIHRSHLVALKYVEELRTNAGRLTVRVGADVLTVSRRHSRHLRDVLVRQARRDAYDGGGK
jgi:two-component system response regulator LytT